MAISVCAGWLPQPDAEFIPVQLRSFAAAAEPPGKTITVDAGSNAGVPTRFTGFLHGVTYDGTQDYTATTDLVSALNPSLWRLADHNNDVYGFVVARAQFPQSHGTLITVIVQDSFNNKYGAPITVGNCDTTRSNCFATFDDLKAAWTSFVDAFVQTISAANLTVHYYDVFAEPNNGWTGVSTPQLYELFKAAHDTVRQRQPQAKIVAPGTSFYSRNFLEQFLTYVVNNNLRLDGLSWHEFDVPDNVPAHVYEMRQFFSANRLLCDPSCPEIHINEYAGSANHLIPGWAVGWLYYLEKAGVDQSHRACWTVPAGWSTCWAGFDGVLLQDNVTPQHLYWVYKWHADTLAGTRLNVDTSSTRVVALARKSASPGEIRILIGRYDATTGSVAVDVKNYPPQYKKSNVTVEKIPGNANTPSALSAVTFVSSSEVAVTNGSMRIGLDTFQDGEAYLVTLKPGGQ